MKSKTHIYAAAKSDIPTLLSFIRELAAFEKLSHEVIVTEALLEQNLFSSQAYAEVLIAESDGTPAGFVLFFHTFSTFLGKPGLYIEDLFVRQHYRNRGFGIGLLRAVAKIAVERDCGRMEWSVLNWNKSAIELYGKIGATALEEWTVQRLTRMEIEALAKE